MTYTITKIYTFDAAHQLADLPEGHKCGRLHGHTYRVELNLAADHLDYTGFVIDFGDLAPFKDIIDKQLDHRCLNDVLPQNPTSEYLARWLYEKAAQLWPTLVAGCTVWETPTSRAEYRP